MKIRQKKPRSRAFALIVTISLMLLLTVIAVGLLTLSSITLRSSDQGEAMAVARSNARLALMLALGDLQKQTGPDTRVTARADVLDEKNPAVLGAWKSWEGTDHETTGTFAGRPVSPGDYAAKKRDRFLSWLVSGSTDATVPDTTASSDKVTLVGAGSVGTGADRVKLQVNLAPLTVATNTRKGACAWWVGGENQKARLPKPYAPASDSVAGWTTQVKSHATADPKPFRLESLLTDVTPASKAITLHQGDLIASKSTLAASSEFFHDLSATSVGLLTNTATGGWRKDLSLLTENWAQQPKTNEPFFRVTPDTDINFTIPVSGAEYRPDKSLIYPWSAYRGTKGINPIYEHGAVSSWENLQNWANLYKSMTNSGTQIATQSFRDDSKDATGNFNFLHKVRIIPIIARVQWVFSHYARASTGTPTPPANTYDPCLLVTPVVTMWNPYNVTLVSSPVDIVLKLCLPNAFRYTVGSTANANYNSLTNSTTYKPLAALSSLTFQIPGSYTYKPGECFLFSPDPKSPPVAAGTALPLVPGFSKNGGHYFNIKNDAAVNLTAIPGSATIKADAKFNSAYIDAGATGVGIYLDMNIGGVRHLAYRMAYDPVVADTVYPAITGLSSATLSQAATDPQPFLTTIFGARTASGTHLAAKGLLQTSPLVNFTAMGSKDSVETTILWDYPGTAHPVNSPFDYSFRSLSGGTGSEYPNTDAANHGFIITGFQSADGLSRCVLAELPTKPIQSLAELQSWDLRYENAIPPYAYNIIGNSDATPIIPSNAVYISGNSPNNPTWDLQHDDFYCANHVFFDDWFVSSIAPNTAGLGAPSASETLQKTFTDFVSGKSPLPNRAYMPIAADASLAQTTTGADNLYTQYASKPDSWRTIASHIEVEGMFNVNSTSVTAWRALLGHARNLKTPYLNASAANTLSGKQDYAISRFSVAGDVDAKSPGASGQFSASSEFAGYRKLDSNTLDRFATEIVKQVRARGPFLSLSEFINRQLSSGDLALAGTIQSALNALEKDSTVNPYSVIEARSKPSTATPPAAASAGYSFPDAAVGYNAFGLPGWTRQADVLRPIAPILSARDDTFTIRGYGDARDATGTKVTARAVCEATVRRTRDYVNSSDAADTATLPKSAVNLVFGRRYQIISFRWLSAAEI